MSLRAKREENFRLLRGEIFEILQIKKSIKRKRNAKENFEILLRAKRDEKNLIFHSVWNAIFFQIVLRAKREENFESLPRAERGENFEN